MTTLVNIYGVTITLKPVLYTKTVKDQYEMTYDQLQRLFGESALIIAEQCKAGQIHYHMYFKTPLKSTYDVHDQIKIQLDNKNFGFIKVQLLRNQKDKLQYIDYMMKSPYINQRVIEEPQSPPILRSDKCLFIDDNSDTDNA